MITLNGVHGQYELEHDKNDNVVTLKCKLAARNYTNAVDMKFKDENDMPLDNNQYIPYGMRNLRYSRLDTSSNDIILGVWENRLGVPKLIQVNPEQPIQELIIIMKNIALEHRELAVFKDNGERLSNDMVIEDCNLRDGSVIKICVESDVELPLLLSNLKDPDQESRSVNLHITDKIEDVKNRIRDELNLDNNLTLLTEKNFFESGRRLIDYAVKRDDVIFYADSQGQNIEILNLIKRGQFATIFKGKIINANRDIILKGYNIKEMLSLLNKEERIKFIKYDITTLFKINTKNHLRFVHMEAMFEKDDYLFIGLELMDQSLDNCLPVTNKDDILRYATQTLEGLSYLHGLKIIYRSLKCSSILLDGDKNVKLSNFHFSKYLLGVTDESRPNNATRSIPIDINWAAPETLRGIAYGFKADSWSFGVTLIEMITGKPLYNGVERDNIKQMLLNNEKPEYVIPGWCPGRVNHIIDCCLNWNPLLRPDVDLLINDINNPDLDIY